MLEFRVFCFWCCWFYGRSEPAQNRQQGGLLHRNGREIYGDGIADRNCSFGFICDRVLV